MSNKLFINEKNSYDNNYDHHFIEQYKLYVKSTEKISSLRQSAINHFIIIDAALISFLGLSQQFNILNGLAWFKAFLPLVGIIICIIFWYLLHSYKQLNEMKFKIIHKIEKKLPMDLYNYEWKKLGKGKNTKIYYPFSRIELLIPIVFGIIYFILIIIFLNI